MLQIIMEHAFVEPARKIDLIAAAKNGRMPELRAKIHLTNVNINSGDKYGDQTGVHWAAKGKAEALQLLLQHGGDPNRADTNGYTPVHMAWKTEDLSLLKAAGGKQ